MENLRHIGTGHVSLCHPTTIASMQETVLYGELALGEQFIAVTLADRPDNPVLVPMSNVAGIVMDKPVS